MFRGADRNPSCLRETGGPNSKAGYVIFSRRDNVCRLEIFIKCLLFNRLRTVWVSGWLRAFTTNTVGLFRGVGACAGVYVPCAATPPFPIFIELCLSPQPWQQKMTNGRTVETLRLCVRARLNGRARLLDEKKSNHTVGE